MTEELFQDNNRKRAPESNSDEVITKRQRLLDEPNHQAHRFLSFHLTVLRSLYPKEEDSENSDAYDGIAIQESTWSTMEFFLKERAKIGQAKRQAAHWEGIYQEALKVSENPTPLPLSPPMVATPSLIRTSQPTTSLLSTPTKTTTEHAFPIIAKLLGQRKVVMSEEYQQQKDTFRSLAEVTELRIERLQQRLDSLQQVMAETEQQQLANVPEDDAQDQLRNRRAALQTKIRLWTWFASDLKDIL